MESALADQEFFMKPIESPIILDVASGFSNVTMNSMPMTCVYFLLYRKYFTQLIKFLNTPNRLLNHFTDEEPEVHSGEWFTHSHSRYITDPR